MEETATGNSAHVLFILAICIIVGPTIISRFRLPGMVGLVLAGMVFGPYVIGWIGPGEMDGLGKIGLLYLMFQAGLEVDMNMVRENRRATCRTPHVSNGARSRPHGELLGVGDRTRRPAEPRKGRRR